jgi:hypothetical protein
MRLLNYLDDVWSDIWDLVVMEVDELRSITPHFLFLLHLTPRNKSRSLLLGGLVESLRSWGWLLGRAGRRRGAGRLL